MVDNANDHEQRRLKRAVGQQEHHTRLRDVVVAGAEQQHHETQLAHRAVGEQQLQVVLTQCTEAADQHRCRANREENYPPVPLGREHRRHAGNEVDAGLHHRGGVEVSTDRRRRHHCARQPATEGRLR